MSIKKCGSSKIIRLPIGPKASNCLVNAEIGFGGKAGIFHVISK
jgi:hypothetical protein